DYSEKAARAADSERERDRIQLTGEALRDMVKPYVALDQVAEPARYWAAKAAPERARQLMRKLAGSFFEAGRFERAIEANRWLLKQAPNESDAPAWLLSIVQALDKQGKRGEVKAT